MGVKKGSELERKKIKKWSFICTTFWESVIESVIINKKKIYFLFSQVNQSKKRREQENNSEKENQSSLVWNKCGGN